MEPFAKLPLLEDPGSVPTRKSPPLDDRIIVAVEDRGIMNGLGNARVLLDSFWDRGIFQMLLSPHNAVATNWWLLRMKSGLRVVYIGTEETFVEFQRTREGHLYEFGRAGKVV